MPNQSVIGASIPGCGRGLIACRKIPRSSAVLSLPFSLVITADYAVTSSAILGAIPEAKLPSLWTILAVWLAEALQPHSQLHSDWLPYVSLLPQTTDGVLEWTDEEVCLLEGSVLHRKALNIRTAAKKSVDEAKTVIGDQLPDHLLRAAFSILLSRLVRLSSLNDMEVLLPFGDLVNHDCHASCYFDYDKKTHAVVLMAHKTYQPGNEVVVSYGEKANGELLLSYGFVPEKLNAHDVCLLELEDGTVIPLKMGAIPQGTTDLEGVIKACKASLQKRPSAMDKNRLELEALSDKTTRKALILKILLEEQKILHRTIFLLQQEVNRKAKLHM